MLSALLLAAAVSLGCLTYNPEEEKRSFDDPPLGRIGLGQGNA